MRGNRRIQKLAMKDLQKCLCRLDGNQRQKCKAQVENIKELALMLNGLEA